MSKSCQRWLVLAVVVLALVGAWVAGHPRHPPRLASETVAPPPPRPPSVPAPRPPRLVTGGPSRDASEPLSAPVGRFRATPGQEFVFALAVRWQTQLAARAEAGPAPGGAGAGPEHRTIDLTAAMHVTVLDYTAPDFVLRCRLDDVRLTGRIEGEQGACTPDRLGEPVLVRFQDNGRIHGYLFPPATPARVKHILATIVA